MTCPCGVALRSGRGHWYLKLLSLCLCSLLFARIFNHCSLLFPLRHLPPSSSFGDEFKDQNTTLSYLGILNTCGILCRIPWVFAVSCGIMYRICTRDMAITVAYGCVFIGLVVSSMNIQCKCLTGTNLLTGVVPCDPDSHQQRWYTGLCS